MQYLYHQKKHHSPEYTRQHLGKLLIFVRSNGFHPSQVVTWYVIGRMKMKKILAAMVLLVLLSGSIFVHLVDFVRDEVEDPFAQTVVLETEDHAVTVDETAERS